MSLIIAIGEKAADRSLLSPALAQSPPDPHTPTQQQQKRKGECIRTLRQSLLLSLQLWSDWLASKFLESSFPVSCPAWFWGYRYMEIYISFFFTWSVRLNLGPCAYIQQVLLPTESSSQPQLVPFKVREKSYYIIYLFVCFFICLFIQI